MIYTQTNMTPSLFSFGFLFRGGLGSLFFFSSRRRHTRWPRDWSSDVCLPILTPPALVAHQQALVGHDLHELEHAGVAGAGGLKIRRASCRDTAEIWVVGP